jgi:peptide/nickel transport system permease protein
MHRAFQRFAQNTVQHGVLENASQTVFSRSGFSFERRTPTRERWCAVTDVDLKTRVVPRWARTPLVRNKTYLFALVLLTLIVTMTLLAPIIAPYDPNLGDLGLSLNPPSAAHWFGTDQQGRDVLSRVIWGGRSTLFAALAVVLISEFIGVPLGLIAAYYGGWADTIITRGLDVILAFPPLLLAFVTASVFGRGLTNAVLTLGIVYAPLIARVVRSVVLVERETAYVEAARALGASDARVMAVHIPRNIISPILVQSSIDLAYAILDLSALGFLGLGVQPPTADWGAMLAEGREHLLLSPNVAIAAGVAVMLSVVSFNLVGDGLRAHFDPKKRAR